MKMADFKCKNNNGKNGYSNGHHNGSYHTKRQETINLIKLDVQRTRFLTDESLKKELIEILVSVTTE